MTVCLSWICPWHILTCDDGWPCFFKCGWWEMPFLHTPIGYWLSYGAQHPQCQERCQNQFSWEVLGWEMKWWHPMTITHLWYWLMKCSQGRGPGPNWRPINNLKSKHETCGMISHSLLPNSNSFNASWGMGLEKCNHSQIHRLQGLISKLVWTMKLYCVCLHLHRLNIGVKQDYIMGSDEEWQLN